MRWPMWLRWLCHGLRTISIGEVVFLSTKGFITDLMSGSKSRSSFRHLLIYRRNGLPGFCCSPCQLLSSESYHFSDPSLFRWGNHLTETPESLWVSYRCSQWFFCLYSTTSWLALLQHPFNSRRRSRNRTQRVIWCARSDCWCMDLQKQ